jgi:regulatory protein
LGIEKILTKIITHIEALEKARSYCAYQERCHQEIEKKLRSFQLNRDEMDYVILLLMQGSYLNEERFARSFVSGKYRIKKWGRNKIVMKLKEKAVSKKCIELGLQEIDTSEYYGNLYHIAERRLEASKETNPFKKKQKVATYLYGRGYESNLIWEVIDELINAE